MECSLPPGFAWYPPNYSRADEDERCLVVGGRQGVEVALARLRADGSTWLVTTNRHLPWERRAHGVHPTRDAALRMASRWATANAGRLKAEAGLKAAPGAGGGVRWDRAETGVQTPLEGRSGA